MARVRSPARAQLISIFHLLHLVPNVNNPPHPVRSTSVSDIYIGSLKHKLRFEEESKNGGGICTVCVVELVYQHLYGLAVQAIFYHSLNV